MWLAGLSVAKVKVAAGSLFLSPGRVLTPENFTHIAEGRLSATLMLIQPWKVHTTGPEGPRECGDMAAEMEKRLVRRAYLCLEANTHHLLKLSGTWGCSHMILAQVPLSTQQG